MADMAAGEALRHGMCEKHNREAWTMTRPSAEPRSFIPYEIPLRPGVTARLVLPVDLTQEEADRLCEVIISVAFCEPVAESTRNTTEGGGVMAKYRVQWRSSAWVSQVVEAEDEADAIEKSFPGGWPDICAQCSGWNRPYNLELGEVWDDPEAELTDEPVSVE